MNFAQHFVMDETDTGILINIAISFAAGIIIALGYLFAQKKKGFSKSFLITLLLLPVVVVVVIPLIATDLKKALSLAGIFALVRFRSIPGDAKDIFYIFFTLTVGVAIALFYYIVAFVLLILVTVVFIIMQRFVSLERNQLLKITIPEDMDYDGIFDGIFEKYLNKCELANIKTSNMGTLFVLEYQVQLKDKSETKKMIDEIRTKNGNLNVVLQIDPDMFAVL